MSDTNPAPAAGDDEALTVDAGADARKARANDQSVCVNSAGVGRADQNLCVDSARACGAIWRFPPGVP